MDNKMKAVVFTDVGEIEIQELKKPTIKSNEVLVKIKASSICTWEQRVYQGINKVDFPFIGGHEQSGVIVDVGSDIDRSIWNVGERVVVGLLTSCEECYYCRMGEEGSCENLNYEKLVGGLSIPGMGGFSEYLAVTTEKLFKIPNSISYEEASLTEPLSCVIHSIELANIRIGQNVLVIGAGIMGIFHALLSRARGAKVIVSEPDESRRKFLNELGFEETFSPLDIDVVEKVKKETNGRGADVIFNTTAISEVAQKCLDMVALYGKIVLYSSFHPDKPLSVSPNMIHKTMVSLMGSANSNSSDFTKALKIIANEIIDVKPLISGIFDFYNFEEAIEKAISWESYRVVIKF